MAPFARIRLRNTIKIIVPCSWIISVSIPTNLPTLISGTISLKALLHVCSSEQLPTCICRNETLWLLFKTWLKQVQSLHFARYTCTLKNYSSSVDT